jgi:TorA maturation chaperone TorD
VRADPDTAVLLRLLANAWLLEPDQETLDRLALLPPLADEAASITPDAAALEYAEVVLKQVPPYASLFLDEEAMLNGPQTEWMQVAYTRERLEIRREWRAGPADHLGLELHFLAHLIERGSEAWRDVLVRDILSWAPICCLAVERIEGARLYGPLARLTRDVLVSLEPSDR